MAGTKRYYDLRYMFMRGLLSHERMQRGKHYLKSAAECTSKAIVSLELADKNINTAKQAQRLVGIGRETVGRLEGYIESKIYSSERPAAGRYVSSAGALLVALLNLTETMADDSQSGVVLIGEDDLRTEAAKLSDETFLPKDSPGFCQAWWRLEVLINRDLVKRRSLNKASVYHLMPLGMETAQAVRARSLGQDNKPAETAAGTDATLNPTKPLSAPRRKRKVKSENATDVPVVVQTTVPGASSSSSATVGSTSSVATPGPKAAATAAPPELVLTDAMYSNDTGQDGVILMVDTRECGGNRAGLFELCEMLEQAGVRYKTRSLTCADYNWLWRCEGVERELPFFLERKRADDLALSLKDGRFWAQITKMTAKKAEFWEKGIETQLQYVIEGKAEKFVTRCSDGCQGVGRCGNPSLVQVQRIVSDLEHNPDLQVVKVDSILETVRHLADLTRQLTLQTERGQFDALVLAEMTQQTLRTAPPTDNKPDARNLNTARNVKSLKWEDPVLIIDDDEEYPAVTQTHTHFDRLGKTRTQSDHGMIKTDFGDLGKTETGFAHVGLKRCWSESGRQGLKEARPSLKVVKTDFDWEPGYAPEDDTHWQLADTQPWDVKENKKNVNDGDKPKLSLEKTKEGYEPVFVLKDENSRDVHNLDLHKAKQCDTEDIYSKETETFTDIFIKEKRETKDFSTKKTDDVKFPATSKSVFCELLKSNNSCLLSRETETSSPPLVLPVLARRAETVSAGQSAGGKGGGGSYNLYTSSGSPRGKVYLMKRGGDRYNPTASLRSPGKRLQAQISADCSPCGKNKDASSNRLNSFSPTLSTCSPVKGMDFPNKSSSFSESVSNSSPCTGAYKSADVSGHLSPRKRLHDGSLSFRTIHSACASIDCSNKISSMVDGRFLKEETKTGVDSKRFGKDLDRRDDERREVEDGRALPSLNGTVHRGNSSRFCSLNSKHSQLERNGEVDDDGDYRAVLRDDDDDEEAVESSGDRSVQRDELSVVDMRTNTLSADCVRGGASSSVHDNAFTPGRSGGVTTASSASHTVPSFRNKHHGAVGNTNTGHEGTAMKKASTSHLFGDASSDDSDSLPDIDLMAKSKLELEDYEMLPPLGDYNSMSHSTGEPPSFPMGSVNKRSSTTITLSSSPPTKQRRQETALIAERKDSSVRRDPSWGDADPSMDDTGYRPPAWNAENGDEVIEAEKDESAEKIAQISAVFPQMTVRRVRTVLRYFEGSVERCVDALVEQPWLMEEEKE